MNAHTAAFTIATRGQGTSEITEEVARVVRASGVQTGTATVFIRHTSASLIIYENADPSARTDLHAFFERLVPEDADYFVHTAEGPDDMPSHVRAALTLTQVSIPVRGGKLQLGTWQGVSVYEHRHAPHRRSLALHYLGT